MKKWIICLLIGFTFIQLSAQDFSNDFFQVEIKGQGEPVLLIPGLACSGEVWEETIAELSNRYECHVFTLAGFAGVPAFSGADSVFLPQIKKGLIRYIEGKGLQKPVIIGHSLGGFLALSIAVDRPALPGKIVIVDSYPFYTAAMNPAATEEQARPQAKMAKNMIRNQTDSTFKTQQQMSMPAMVSKAEDVEKVVQWSMQTDRRVMSQAMYELMTTDLRDEAAQVECPVLVLGSWYAGKDYGMTKDSVKNTFEGQYQKVGEVNIAMAEKARHFIMLDEFDWFMEKVNTFLE